MAFHNKFVAKARAVVAKVKSVVSAVGAKVTGKRRPAPVMKFPVSPGASISRGKVEQPSYRDTVSGKVYTTAGLKDAGISPDSPRIDQGQDYVPAGFSPVLGGGNIAAPQRNESSVPSTNNVLPTSSGQRSNIQGVATPISTFSPSTTQISTNPAISAAGLGSRVGGLTNIVNVDPRTAADYNKFTPPVNELTQPDTTIADQSKIDNDLNATIQKLFDQTPTMAEMEAQAREQSGKIEAQQRVNQYSANLNKIVTDSQANQLSLVGQGRGIPEAIIGGQQAQIAREAAIQSLPVAAQLAQAQGNFELANEHYNTLFKIYAEDATNKFKHQMDVVKNVRDQATAAQKLKLDAVAKKEERLYKEGQENRDDMQKTFAQYPDTRGFDPAKDTLQSLGAKIAATSKIYADKIRPPVGGASDAKEAKNDIATAIQDFQNQIRDRGWLGANPQAYAYYKKGIIDKHGASAGLELDNMMADLGIIVDYENK